MTRFRTLIYVAVVLLFVSCGPPEDLPKPDTVLPKGYSRKVVPHEFLEELGFGSRSGRMWVRCFDCKEDWDGLNTHILNTLGSQGFKETTSEWIRILNKGQNSSSEESKFLEKVVRMYSSELGYAHLMLMDLKEMKKMGAAITTSGDFLILAAIDNMDQY